MAQTNFYRPLEDSTFNMDNQNSEEIELETVDVEEEKGNSEFDVPFGISNWSRENNNYKALINQCGLDKLTNQEIITEIEECDEEASSQRRTSRSNHNSYSIFSNISLQTELEIVVKLFWLKWTPKTWASYYWLTVAQINYLKKLYNRELVKYKKNLNKRLRADRKI